MKIVYLHQYFNTSEMAGSTRSYEFARRLVRDGHEVHIVTSDRNAISSDKSWILSQYEGINVHSIAQPYDNSMNAGKRIAAFFAFALRASMRARSLRADVVFATSTPLTIVVPALVATFGRRTPFVMEVRDLWPTVPIALGYLKNPVLRALAVGLERLAYHRASRIIALSQGMAEGVTKTAGPTADVAVIPNMSDTLRFRTAPEDKAGFDEKYPELKDRNFVVYTGTFGRVNGVDYMAKLAKEYLSVDPTLAFVAMGEGAEKRRTVDQAASLGVLGNNFFVYDAIAKREIPAILAQATACSSWVIPVKELEANSANKLFDGFAAGKPVFINYGGWQQDLLESTGAGLALHPTDLRVAAQQLSSFLNDGDIRSFACTASARLGEDVFETERLYKQFAEVLCSSTESASDTSETDQLATDIGRAHG